MEVSKLKLLHEPDGDFNLLFSGKSIFYAVLVTSMVATGVAAGAKDDEDFKDVLGADGPWGTIPIGNGVRGQPEETIPPFHVPSLPKSRLP